MSEVKFYLNNAQSVTSTLYAVIYDHGRRYKVATGISIQSKNWNAEKMRCREKSDFLNARITNEQLRNWETLLTNVMNSFNRDLIVPSQSEFKQAVKLALEPFIHPDERIDNDFISFAETYIKQAARKPRTLIRYQTTINLLQRFQKAKRKRITFDSINQDFYEALKKYMDAENYSLNYFGDIVKNIKVFMNAAADRDLHQSTAHRSKKFKVMREESDSIYLSTDKLKILANLDITPQFILSFESDQRPQNIHRRVQSLIDARDRFLIGAYTALRFSDFNILKGLEYTDEYINARAIKTGTRTVIPMHPIIREILIRRENSLPSPISNQKMNEALHLLCKVAGFNQMISISRTEGGQLKNTLLPEYELITTHTARRSACTNMYLAGIPIRTIMAFSGHKTIKSFMAYIKAESLEDAARMKDHPYFRT